MRSFLRQNPVILIFLTAVPVFLAFQNCSQNGDITVSPQSEPLTHNIVDQPGSTPVCQEVSADAVKPKLLYAWDYANDIEPTYKQVMASPAVGDIDGDGKAEIVFTSYLDTAYSGKGVLRVLSGITGMPKFSISSEALRPFATTTPLLVDLDHDGKAEIVYLHASRTKAIALNFDGSLRWELPFGFTNETTPKAIVINSCHHGFSAAKLYNDNTTQILAGRFIIEENSFRVPRTILDYQKEQSVMCTSFAASLKTQPNSELNILDRIGVADNNGHRLFEFLRPGFPAVADLMPKVPGIEVVVSGGGNLTIYNGLTGEVLIDKSLSEHSEIVCGNGLIGGGQATIGHFSGSPNQLEIAVATGRSLTIFNNRGEIVAGSVTQDCSSLATGLTSFDFNGDGKPEIIYGDERYIRIYEMDGTKDLKTIWKDINPSGTIYEYPVVADLDGSGAAKLIVVANNMWVENNGSRSYVEGATGENASVRYAKEENPIALATTGLRVFAPSQANSWMPTRAVWNQHAYFVANILDDLTATATTVLNVFQEVRLN
ncbi:MAG: VCBS repeat-containing protein [Bdellovibrionales bacterium]|nr:VCBS repeat-containing protein [Bdellovibrionales bacterium]